MELRSLLNYQGKNEDKRRLFARPLSLIVGLLLVVAVLFVWAVPSRASTIPTLTVTSVVTDKTVTVQTHDFPPNQNFVVTMGPFGSKGVNGIVVATTNSGVGGSFSVTYDIPSQLAGSRAIAIRMQTAHAYPFYAFNWFWNNSAGTGVTPPTTPPTGPIQTVAPTFKVCGVVQNTSVTVRTKDFPANQVFTVTMGPFGTQGVGGYVVGTINSGIGGELTATFNIPGQLAGSRLIAVRMQTPGGSPYFAYNWFYNNTATVC